MAAGWRVAPRRGAASPSCRWPIHWTGTDMGRATDVVVDGFALTDKRALVVGAETRVGRVIASALAEAGARLALASSPDADDGASGKLSPNGSNHLTVAGSPDDLVRPTIAELGGLDIVVN